MIPVIVIVISIAFVLLGWFLRVTYNGLVTHRLHCKEAYAGIDVQLKRRLSLIPNLVEMVRGYASHERQIFENVTRARAQLDNAGTMAMAAEATNMLTQALRSLFAVAEAYPQLKANENFLQLQRDIGDTEEKIANARQVYNRNVLTYNQAVAVFPKIVIAKLFGFHPGEFFEAADVARPDLRVSFGPDMPASGAGPAMQPPASRTG